METKLSRLRPHFNALSPDEKMQLILGIRANRRIPKRVDGTEVNTKPRRVATKKPVTKKSAAKLIAALSPADIAALIAELGGE